LQHLDLPQMFSGSERRFRSVAWHRSARGAQRVIAISEFVRGRAVDGLGLEPARVRAVPLGIDHGELRPGTEEREPFLLYPARRWPHKTGARWCDAFGLRRGGRPEWRWVLPGGGDSPNFPAGVGARGRVPRADLVSLMQGGGALVFPSLYGGFGQPP